MDPEKNRLFWVRLNRLSPDLLLSLFDPNCLETSTLGKQCRCDSYTFNTCLPTQVTETDVELMFPAGLTHLVY